LSGKTTANSVLPPTTQEKTDSGIPKWTLGSILLDCSEISSISQDSQGNLYAAGAGKNKVWIKKSDVDFWSGINLPECIAVYAIMAGNPVIAGGWNNGKRGRMWSKSGTEWDNGTDIEKSYVIRSIVAKK
jgi:hypothetical protein